jgi:hypothetical protein
MSGAKSSALHSNDVCPCQFIGKVGTAIANEIIGIPGDDLEGRGTRGRRDMSVI